CWFLGGVDGVSAGFIILAFSGSKLKSCVWGQGSINPCGGGGGAGKARSSLQSLVRELAWSPKHVMETVVDPSLKHIVVNVPLYRETQHELDAITTGFSNDSYSCILNVVASRSKGQILLIACMRPIQSVYNSKDIRMGTIKHVEEITLVPVRTASFSSVYLPKMRDVQFVKVRSQGLVSSQLKLQIMYAGMQLQ
ncbi:hypothetical protein Tco_0503350, partial [Tanacetum coccineum]